MSAYAPFTGADFQALLAYLLLGSGVLVLALTISLRRNHRIAAGLALVVLLASAVASLVFSADVAPRQVTPLIVVDGYSLYFSVLFTLAALAVAALSYHYLQGARDEPEEFYLLLLTATLGGMTLAGADHFATLLLGLEILSVSLYVLVAYPREGHPPLEAALKYLILSGAASAILFFGIALIYLASGSLAFAAPHEVAGDARLYLEAGVVMVLAGAGFKLSLVPFHMWTPDVYQGAPAPVTAYLATVSKGAMFAVMLRFLLETSLIDVDAVVVMLTLLAVLSMLVGNLLALRQRHLKRLLGCSAIAHVGYLLIPLVAVGRLDPGLAAEATLVYLGAYVIMTLAAFGVVTVLSAPDAEADALVHYRGLFWRRPLMAAMLTAALLSLAGIPLTVGFIAKFYVFVAGVTAIDWLLLSALVAGTGIGLYYYLGVVFLMARSEAGAGRGLAPVTGAGGLTLGVLSALLVWLGVYPSALIHAVRVALSSWSG